MNSVTKQSLIKFEDFVTKDLVYLTPLQFLLLERFREMIPEKILEAIKPIKTFDNSRNVKLLEIAYNNLGQSQIHAIAISVLGRDKFINLCKSRSKQEFDSELPEKIKALKEKINALKKKISQRTKFSRSLNLNPLNILRVQLVSILENPRNLINLNKNTYTLKTISRSKETLKVYSKKEVHEMMLSFGIESFYDLSNYFLTGNKIFLDHANKELIKLNDLLVQSDFIQTEKMKEILEIIQIIQECNDDPEMLLPLLIIPLKEKNRELGNFEADQKLLQTFLDCHRVQSYLIKHMLEELKKFPKINKNCRSQFIKLEELTINLKISFDIIHKEISKIQERTSTLQHVFEFNFIDFRNELMKFKKLIFEINSTYNELNSFLNGLKNEVHQVFELKKLFDKVFRENTKTICTISQELSINLFECGKNLDIISLETQKILKPEEKRIRSEYVSSMDILMHKFFIEFDSLFPRMINVDLGPHEKLKSDACDYLRTIRKEADDVLLGFFEKAQENKHPYDENFSQDTSVLKKKIKTVIDDLKTFSLIIPLNETEIHQTLKNSFNLMDLLYKIAHTVKGVAFLVNPLIGNQNEVSKIQEDQFLSNLQSQIVSTLRNAIGRAFHLELLLVLKELLDADEVSFSYRINCIEWLNNYISFTETMRKNLKEIVTTPKNLKISIPIFIKLWKEHIEFMETMPDEPKAILSEENSKHISRWEKLQVDLQNNLLDFFSASSHPLLKYSIISNLSKVRKRRKSNAGNRNVSPTRQAKSQEKKDSPEPAKSAVIEPKIVTAPQKGEVEKEVEAVVRDKAFFTCLEKLYLIENFCHRIPELLFTTINPTPQQAYLQNFKSEAVSNLSQTMLQLHEVLRSSTAGRVTPSNILTVHLMIALAIEQALKLIIASREIYVPGTKDHLLMSKETSHRRLIDKHQISLLLAMLNEKGEGLGPLPTIDAEDKTLIDTLDLFIPLTSRYEIFGDGITKRVEEARDLRKLIQENPGRIEYKNSLQEIHEWVEQSLDRGLNIVINILDCLDVDFKILSAGIRRNTINGLPDLSLNSPRNGDVVSQPLDAAGQVQGIIEELEKIDAIREDYNLRKVIKISNEKFEDVLARKRYAASALNRFKMAVKALQDALLDPLDPSACLTSAKFIFLKCAVAMEQASLLLLYHLPIQNPKDRFQHFLFKDTGHELLKHSHRIKEFILSLLVFGKKSKREALEATAKNLLAFSEGMELFIKQLYRYNLPGQTSMQNLLAKLESLSQMRFVLNDPELSEENRRRIVAMLPSEEKDCPLNSLDRIISTTLMNEVNAPVSEMLGYIKELIMQYRQMLEE